jgi:hypothetical protein
MNSYNRIYKFRFISLGIFHSFQIVVNLKLPRFKIVVQTVIGQMRDQGIRIASRCLWDTSTDNYASVQYKNVRESRVYFYA